MRKYNLNVLPIRVPPIEQILPHRVYGNKYISFTRYVTKFDRIEALVGREEQTFPSTQEGVAEMVKWLNANRRKMIKALANGI